MFVCRKELSGAVVCSSDSPELLEIVWDWLGGRVCEFGFSRAAPVGLISVPYCWESGTVLLEHTAEALAQFLEELYRDPEEICAAVEQISHSD